LTIIELVLLYYTKEGTSKIKGSIFAISVLLLVIITGSGCVHSTWTSQEPQPLETEPEPALGQAPEIQSPVPVEDGILIKMHTVAPVAEKRRQLTISADGSIVYFEDRGLIHPTEENPPIRTKKTGQLTEAEIDRLLKMVDACPFDAEGNCAAHTKIIMTDAKSILTVDYQGEKRTITANYQPLFHLFSKNVPELTDVPEPVRELYRELKNIIDNNTSKISEEAISETDEDLPVPSPPGTIEMAPPLAGFRESGLTRLTEQEEAKLIAIASRDDRVQAAIASGVYKTGLVWVGVLDSGGHGLLPYERTLEKGIPLALEWTKEAAIYPGVTFNFGTHVITVAVDLEKEEVVYTTGGLIRSGPSSNIERPRELTQLEKDVAIEIALSTPEALDRLDAGEPYRTEIIWVAKEGTEWRSHNYNIKDEADAYDAEWYPGVMIGFGSPQEWLIAVAADLAADKAIHVESFADVPRVESNLEYLNEEQKTRIVEIACEAAGVSEQSAHKVEYVWIGISEDSKYTLEYEVVEKGIPEYAWSETITYYPGVRFILGSSVIKVAINLDTDEVVFRDGFPARKGPVPAR
jgi:hypothetical protein